MSEFYKNIKRRATGFPNKKGEAQQCRVKGCGVTATVQADNVRNLRVRVRYCDVHAHEAGVL